MLADWSALEDDLHELYGIDVTLDLLRSRSARWLRTRIGGVLSANTRTARRLGTYQRRPADPAPFPPPRR